MTTELRDPELAKAWLLQSAQLARAMPQDHPNCERLRLIIHHIAADGSPVPPVFFVADLYQLALSLESVHIPVVAELPWNIPSSLIQRYEDYILGRFVADASFRRAVDALLKYKGDERDKAFAFMLIRISSRCGIPGTIVNPSLMTHADLHAPYSDVDAKTVTEAQALIIEQTQNAVTSILKSGSALGEADFIELEKKTAITAFGQRLALRQTVDCAAAIETNLPELRFRKIARDNEVATNIEDEDTYPVGGFNSVANKGSIESLLHSQLAFMEPDSETRPDLFDIRYVRDELLYYSRDENQFWRRRATFTIVLLPELKNIRVKQADKSWQQIIVLLASLLVVVRQLVERLSDDALSIQILVADDSDAPTLADEQTLLSLLFQDQMESGIVTIDSMPVTEALQQANDGKHVGHQSLVVSMRELPLNLDTNYLHVLSFQSNVPELRYSRRYQQVARHYDSELEAIDLEMLDIDGLEVTSRLLFDWICAHYGG